MSDAVAWLRPFAGLLKDLSVSYDSYHQIEQLEGYVSNARAAAAALEIPLGTITISEPADTSADMALGKLPDGKSAVMFRGRAAQKLVRKAVLHPWQQFDICPYENLLDPGRVHVDPFGHLHLCQGISLGNIYETPLNEICEQFDPTNHPISGPLLASGPAGLARRYAVDVDDQYADACHLCDSTRRTLRTRFPNILTPDQMYGVPN